MKRGETERMRKKEERQDWGKGEEGLALEERGTGLVSGEGCRRGKREEEGRL